MKAYQYSAKYYDRLLAPFIRPIRYRVLKLVKNTIIAASLMSAAIRVTR